MLGNLFLKIEYCYRGGIESQRPVFSVRFCLFRLEKERVCAIVIAYSTARGRAVAARQAHNLKVVGSIPSPATISNFLNGFYFAGE